MTTRTAAYYVVTFGCRAPARGYPTTEAATRAARRVAAANPAASVRVVGPTVGPADISGPAPVVATLR